MRYIVFGAGAIGGAIGGQLALAGHEVVLVARGANLRVLRSDGLRLTVGASTVSPKLTVAGSLAEAAADPGDVVFLTVKSQDTEAAVVEMDVVGPDVAVVCAQNGVRNERSALRRGLATYAMCVMLPATHLHPGAVTLRAAPVSGILDIGRFPHGVDGTAQRIAADLAAATFSSRADRQVMRWKYTKLLHNLGNALDAACGRPGRESDLYRRARAEGEACYRAAGIDFASVEEDRARRTVMTLVPEEAGAEQTGSSSWQSLARHTGSIEADWLNGEIVLLGGLHGVRTPVNEALRRVANRMARDGVIPGTVPVEQIEAEVAAVERIEDGAGIVG